jgi:hypothetical protein
MKNAVVMDSGAMISIPSFIEISSDIEKLIGGKYRHVDTHKPNFFFFFKEGK